MTYPKLQDLIAKARAESVARGSRYRAGLVYPTNEIALEAMILAEEEGFATPVFYGDGNVITELLTQYGLKPQDYTIHDTGSSPQLAAKLAVAHIGGQKLDFLVKGNLHTEELLAEVLRKEAGLRTGRRLSHAFIFDLPDYPHDLILADCVVNIAPGVKEKRDILQNTIDLAHQLGIALPQVGLLSATESVNPAMVSTLDAVALRDMAKEGIITGAELEGPLAFDGAVSSQAQKIKGLKEKVYDILLVPNLEAGNILYKSLIYMAKAEAAGLILGCRAPIVLTSRADSKLTRLASCALGVIASRGISLRPL